MNRSRNHSVAHHVLTRILKSGGDTLWTYPDFNNLEMTSVAAALSRLHRAGKLQRIRRGIYYYPKMTAFGESKPNPEEVVDAIFRASKISTMEGGSTSYNRLGITTQISGAIHRVADRRVHLSSILNVPVRIEVRSHDSIVGITPEERGFLDALRNLTRIPDTTPGAVLERLGHHLKSKTVSFERLVRYARKEPPRVRALLGALGDSVLNTDSKCINFKSLDKLRSTLNPLTTYKLKGAARSLTPNAYWRLA